MGKSVTPKYRLEIGLVHCQAWHGKVSDQRLADHIARYVDSLKIGGVNQHISLDLGYIPIPNSAQIVEQKTGNVVATWKAPMFMTF